LAARGARIQFIKVGWEPDGTFPLGLPNPLLPENRAYTAEAVRRSGADLGLAWDGDFDRCFFFDESGAFIEGYYLVGLLAGLFLEKIPGAAIVHDPRLTWNTIDLVERAGGRPVVSKTGHVFMKAALLAAAESRYGPAALKAEHLDGLSLEMPEWRFNLRASNTEPLIRLNLESRGRPDLVVEKVAELEALIRSFGASEK